MRRLACSKRSDSGERCEVKKVIKSRGGLGREVRDSALPLLCFFFFALFFTSHRSPLSECLEQANPRRSQGFAKLSRILSPLECLHQAMLWNWSKEKFSPVLKSCTWSLEHNQLLFFVKEAFQNMDFSHLKCQLEWKKLIQRG